MSAAIEATALYVGHDGQIHRGSRSLRERIATVIAEHSGRTGLSMAECLPVADAVIATLFADGARLVPADVVQTIVAIMDRLDRIEGLGLRSEVAKVRSWLDSSAPYVGTCVSADVFKAIDLVTSFDGGEDGAQFDFVGYYDACDIVRAWLESSAVLAEHQVAG